jgi:hypothetical protein
MQKKYTCRIISKKTHTSDYPTLTTPHPTLIPKILKDKYLISTNLKKKCKIFCKALFFNALKVQPIKNKA